MFAPAIPGPGFGRFQLIALSVCCYQFQNKNFVRQSIYLALGYASGQGLVFIWQLYAKHTGHQYEAGLTVLLVSILSFPLQFADFGNQSLILKRIVSGAIDDVGQILTARALLAVTLTSALGLAGTFSAAGSTVSWQVWVVIPIIGALAGISGIAVDEARGNYKAVALRQALPWQFLGLACPLLLLGPRWDLSIAVLVLVATATASLNYNGSLQKLKLGTISIAALCRIVAVSAPPILGQIWGRVVIVLLATTVGIVQLADFGIVKYLQVFILLSSGFVLRPLMTNFITRRRGEDFQSASVTSFVRSTTHAPWLLALIGPLAALTMVCIGRGNVWLIMLVVPPFAVIGSVCAQLNQLILMPQRALAVDTCALLTNCIIFLALLRWSAPFAIAAGEASQAIFLILCNLKMTKAVH